MARIKATPFILMLVKDADMLEHDAKSQYRFNRYCAIAFLFVSAALPFFPGLYDHAFSNLLFAEIASLSTFATFYGNMTSAVAMANAIRTNKRLREIQAQGETTLGLLGVEDEDIAL